GVRRVLDDGASRRRDAVTRFTEGLRLGNGRREIFKLLLEALAKETLFDLYLALLVDKAGEAGEAGKDVRTSSFVSVSREPLAPPLRQWTQAEMLKTAAILE